MNPTTQRHHEAGERAEYFLFLLRHGKSIPWYHTHCNMHDIWDSWLNERAPLKTGKDYEDITPQDLIRADVRADWGEYLWEWCQEAVSVEKR